MKSANATASIVIIDYGMGNVRSVQCALARLGYDATITADRTRIERAAGLILPGVGAFGKAMENLKQRDLISVLDSEVIDRDKPILGICLGMQLFAEASTEMGEHEGLGWIPGSVNLIDTGDTNLSIPHVGWNNLEITDVGRDMYFRLDQSSHFYFDHSYHLETDDNFIACTSHYGTQLTAGVRRDNIWGAQFHPEKSQTAGLKLLRNFLNFVQASSLPEEQAAC